jgi:drug/metabolite transporter (DMT)-like permease
MPPSNLIGVLFALFSAALWGGADFSGGFASRRMRPFQVLVISSILGTAALLVFALLLRENLFVPRQWFWGTLAGAAGLLGLAALYHGLAHGQAAVVSPIAGVIGASLPVIFTALTQGWPSSMQLLGFLLAIGGIWLAARTAGGSIQSLRQGLWMAFLAGSGFGIFFVAIAQAGSEAVFTPLAIAKLASLILAGLVVWRSGQTMPSLTSNRAALLAGILDAGANACYMLATRFTRLDVAVVLSSLYPASTVLLARGISAERITPWQWLGVGMCVSAIGFIVS